MKLIVPLVCLVLAVFLVQFFSDDSSGKASIQSKSLTINMPFGKAVQWILVYLVLYLSITQMPDINVTG